MGRQVAQTNQSGRCAPALVDGGIDGVDGRLMRHDVVNVA
jgi:hypothetical protein